jgi:hypothetical protein
MHYSYEKCDSNHKGAKFLRDYLGSFTKFNLNDYNSNKLIKKIWNQD